MMIFDGREHDLGGGFKVRRILPFAKKRMVGPFIFLDHMGPVDVRPGQNIDVRPHPHIGLSTLTYLFEGRMVHHDSLGQRLTIEPGQVNWMTAGRGIAHSERSHDEDRMRAHRLHGLQFWVALPDGKEEIAPTFQHYAQIPRVQADGYRVNIVAGSAFGKTSPVAVHSPLIFAEFKCERSTRVDLGQHPGFETALYLIGGGLKIDGQTLKPGQMAVFESELNIVEASADAHFVQIGGLPFQTPRLIWWNLVSSSQERIEIAKRDWKEGRFPMVPGESEFIPLPEN